MNAVIVGQVNYLDGIKRTKLLNYLKKNIDKPLENLGPATLFPGTLIVN